LQRTVAAVVVVGKQWSSDRRLTERAPTSPISVIAAEFHRSLQGSDHHGRENPNQRPVEAPSCQASRSARRSGRRSAPGSGEASRSKRLPAGSGGRPRAAGDVARNGGRAHHRATAAEHRAGRCRRREYQTRFQADAALAARIPVPPAKDSPVTIARALAAEGSPEPRDRLQGDLRPGPSGLGQGCTPTCTAGGAAASTAGTRVPRQRAGPLGTLEPHRPPSVAGGRSEVGQERAICSSKARPLRGGHPERPGQPVQPPR
jgi:hypothetical protein